MVKLLSYDISNTYFGIAAVIAIGILVWIWIKNKDGREGEERREEEETDALRKDEVKAERAQKDEKKVCARMMSVLDDILEVLRRGGMGELYDKVMSEAISADVMLRRLRDEKMSVERAVETFKELHASLNKFISEIPRDNKKINNLVEQLAYYQKREYTDLITELNMDGDKKARLRKLWDQVNDEEQGSGSAAA